MNIDKIRKELEIISGSRKRNASQVKDLLRAAKTAAQNQNYQKSNAISMLISAYATVLIEEKLEALNKTLLYISEKDGA